MAECYTQWLGPPRYIAAADCRLVLAVVTLCSSSPVLSTRQLILFSIFPRLPLSLYWPTSVTALFALSALPLSRSPSLTLSSSLFGSLPTHPSSCQRLRTIHHFRTRYPPFKSFVCVFGKKSKFKNIRLSSNPPCAWATLRLPQR